MKKRLLLIALVLLAIGLGGILSRPAAAQTVFNCSINATNSNGKLIGVNGAICSALVVYFTTDANGVILDTGEEQSLMRSCKILGGSSACTATFDDSDVTIDSPFALGIKSVTPMEITASELRTRGCISTNLSRKTGSDGDVKVVDLTYNISCP